MKTTYHLRVEGMLYPLAEISAVSREAALVTAKSIAEEHNVVSWELVELGRP